MTRDHARKKAIRARMDASGESYSTAARKLGAAEADGDPAALADLVVARVNSTLASPRARIEIRADWDSGWGLGRTERHRPGTAGRLAASAKAVVKRISAETGLANAGEKLRTALLHPAGAGFIEPSAGRYQIDFGKFAIMQFDGQHHRGMPGTPLGARHRGQEHPGAPLELLRKLRGVTDARQAGHESVRGTPCQVIAVRVGSAEFTVWIDDEHIRRVQTDESGSSERINLSLRKTLELWDFGTGDVPADWTRLPSFRRADQGMTADR